mmetsp:Transcript_74695/g.131925  ORF Transcript_74695/g.131925 Transcript_74695/m.131925 type:complete len:219 (+) Transcript_74695:1616-2272(+)
MQAIIMHHAARPGLPGQRWVFPGQEWFQKLRGLPMSRTLHPCSVSIHPWNSSRFTPYHCGPFCFRRADRIPRIPRIVGLGPSSHQLGPAFGSGARSSDRPPAAHSDTWTSRRAPRRPARAALMPVLASDRGSWPPSPTRPRLPHARPQMGSPVAAISLPFGPQGWRPAALPLPLWMLPVGRYPAHGEGGSLAPAPPSLTRTKSECALLLAGGTALGPG